MLEPHAHALRLGSAAVLAAGRRSRAAVAAAPVRRCRRHAAGRGLYLRFLALTSINPLTVAYFAALIAGLPAVASAPVEAKAVFVAAAGLASLSWQLVLAGAGAMLHRRLPESTRLYTALVGNALVLALAAHMALAA